MGFNVPENITPAYSSSNILEANTPRFRHNVPYYNTSNITDCNNIQNATSRGSSANGQSQSIRPQGQQMQRQIANQTQAAVTRQPASAPRQQASTNPMGAFGEFMNGSGAGATNVQRQLNQTAANQRQPVQQVVQPQRPAVAPPPRQIGLPQIKTKVQQGQKIDIAKNGAINRFKLIIGWDIKDSRCDVDMSAFMLGENGKCPGDDWFIFYGQPSSIDKSISYTKNQNGANSFEKACVNIDINKINNKINKIAIVLTIDEALSQGLNFSMLANTYLKIVDAATNNEICTFVLTGYYKEVTSMVLGEVYKYKDTWKFNCIGNGVAKDLAGLCEMYGIETSD